MGVATSDRRAGHQTASEFHSLPHQTTDVTKILRRDPGRKVVSPKSNYIGHFSVPHRTSQISRTSFKVVLISSKSKVDLFHVKYDTCFCSC